MRSRGTNFGPLVFHSAWIANKHDRILGLTAASSSHLWWRQYRGQDPIVVVEAAITQVVGRVAITQVVGRSMTVAEASNSIPSTLHKLGILVPLISFVPPGQFNPMFSGLLSLLPRPRIQRLTLIPSMNLSLGLPQSSPYTEALKATQHLHCMLMRPNSNIIRLNTAPLWPLLSWATLFHHVRAATWWWMVMDGIWILVLLLTWLTIQVLSCPYLIWALIIIF